VVLGIIVLPVEAINGEGIGLVFTAVGALGIIFLPVETVGGGADVGVGWSVLTAVKFILAEPGAVWGKRLAF